MTILLDPGHGSDTPGKRSPDGRFREYEFNRGIAARVASKLTSLGLNAEIIVPELTDIPLKERVSRVNSHCAALGKENVILVSIHANAAGNGSKWFNATGWSVYTSKGCTKSDDFATCLAENGFMDSRESLAYISSRAGKVAITNLHVEGIIEYLQGNI